MSLSIMCFCVILMIVSPSITTVGTGGAVLPISPFKNSVLWADIAHPINMGRHGDPDSLTGEVLENVTVRNIDILEHDEDDPLYQGSMNIDCGDKNIVRNVLFEDIRVESIQEGRLFCLKVLYNPKYNKAPGNSIEEITFRNITYDGVGENPSLIKGIDENHSVRNITLRMWSSTGNV